MTAASMRSVCLFALLSTLGLAQGGFNYSDFSNVSTLTRHGSAVQAGSSLQLTTNAVNQNGIAWHATPQPVLAGFETTFSFRSRRRPSAPSRRG